MTAFQIDTIIQDVKTAMDQNSADEKLIAFDDIDTLSINKIIRSNVAEAVKIVHCQAPVHLLDSGYDFGNEIYWNESHKSGYITLPADFMRLVVFKMNDWERPVFEAITPDNPLYLRQSSRHKGIRGNAQKPVCAITFSSTERHLEFYSCKSTEAKISQAVYIPYPKIIKLPQPQISICSKCYSSVIYMTAALTAVTLNDNNLYKAFCEMSKALLI